MRHGGDALSDMYITDDLHKVTQKTNQSINF